MKKILILTWLITVSICTFAQERPDFRNSYYTDRRNMQESMPIQKETIVMFGNSITERGMWNEFFPGKKIVNRGIGGDRVPGMIDRMPYVAETKPKQIFILAGANDVIFTNVTTETFEKEYRELIEIIKSRSPQTKIYLQSMMPVNDEVDESTAGYFKDKNEKIKEYNNIVRKLAVEFNIPYIDMHPLMEQENGKLNTAYTADGIHLNGEGYKIWVSILKNYIK